MNLTTLIALPVGLFFLALSLFTTLLRWRANTRRRRDILASIRLADMARLRRVRQEFEQDGGCYGRLQVCLLYDVCMALGLDEGQAQHVIGPALELVIDTPILPDGREEAP